ncbi:TIR domain-containing protein [Actinokineospora auranticolor]|uniref:TIR domain-containing protein n=1 Tax=Actinokineospora auranticolor TaxID=155976 RepID=A0A2S6GBD6_9PSEU|nr:TIR domain-containing protein [Actinokineospora auranticolor]
MYKYDVFISYQRDSPTVAPWVRTHFHQLLCELLDDNTDEEISVYYDEEGRAGGLWPVEIRHALRHSRVLVPVCSPKYFRREWCMAEWHSMQSREKIAGLGTLERPFGLIHPVIYSDSEYFPKYVHERRTVDLRPWNFPEPHFQDTPAFLDLRRALTRFAIDLIDALDLVPRWRPDWPIEMPPPEPPTRSRKPRF